MSFRHNYSQLHEFLISFCQCFQNFWKVESIIFCHIVTPHSWVSSQTVQRFCASYTFLVDSGEAIVILIWLATVTVSGWVRGWDSVHRPVDNLWCQWRWCHSPPSGSWWTCHWSQLLCASQSSCMLFYI